MRSGNEKPAGNTLCIGKDFEAAWAYFCPAKPCVSLPSDGTFLFLQHNAQRAARRAALCALYSVLYKSNYFRAGGVDGEVAHLPSMRKLGDGGGELFGKGSVARQAEKTRPCAADAESFTT